MLKRRENKRVELQNIKNLDLKDENEWPTLVPIEPILQYLVDYREGTIWKEPHVCAVCAQYSEKVNKLSFGHCTVQSRQLIALLMFMILFFKLLDSF